MIEAQEYYPNKEGIADENGKVYRYAYRGKGFKNKRTLHRQMVEEFLNSKGRVEILVDQSVSKLVSVYPDKTEDELNRMISVGFFNMTLSAVHNDLEELNKQLESGHTVKVIAYTMPHGRPSTVDGFYISSKDFNEEGLKIISDKLNYDVGEVKEDGTLNASISENPLTTEPSAPLKGHISPDPLA